MASTELQQGQNSGAVLGALNGLMAKVSLSVLPVIKLALADALYCCRIELDRGKKQRKRCYLFHRGQQG